MNTHSQHKDILFLVSLSPEIIADLEKKEIDISYYLNKIKSFTNVDYRETISRENLAIANQYKVVIVVGHRKGDSLELSNRSLFPLADIVTSLPSDFSGVIDVFVCNSTVIHDAIKKRCPNALVLTANEKTGIDFRIPIYSILLQNLPANTNYCNAYFLLLRRMETFQNSISEQKLNKRPMTMELGGGVLGDTKLLLVGGGVFRNTKLFLVGEGEVLGDTKPLSVGEGEVLGDTNSPLLGRNFAHNLSAAILRILGWGDTVVKQKMLSISSPEFVTRGYTFFVRIFLHYDSEKGAIDFIAKWRDHDTKYPLQLKTIKDIHKGDKIDIKLSMMDVAIQPTILILVCDREHSYTKQSITISDDRIDEEFEVCVKENYNYSECWARLEIRKSDASEIEIINPFLFKITIKEEYGNIEKQQNCNVGLTYRSNLVGIQNMNLDFKCFRHTNEFVRQQVKAIVSDFYLGKGANLALIEIACFDHGLLLKRNNHKAFIETLVAWGTITCVDVTKIANSMAYKMGKVPTSGYQEWVGGSYVNDKKTCTDIGKKLGATIPYSRKGEG